MKQFWQKHCDRLIYMLLALTLAGMIYWLGMEDEAKVIFIGLAMLCYNKARGADSNGNNKGKDGNNPDK